MVGGWGGFWGIVPDQKLNSKDRSDYTAFAREKKYTCDWDLMLDGISHPYVFQNGHVEFFFLLILIYLSYSPSGSRFCFFFGTVWEISTDQSTLMQTFEPNAIKAVHTH